MPLRFSKILHALGSTLALVGIGFVVLLMAKHGSQLESVGMDSTLWWLIAGCSLVYGMANIALAMAWMHLLRYFKASVSPPLALGIYGMTLPAKYIPGNIMHLAGRQALGIANGINGWALARASLYELALIVLAGLSFSTLVLAQIVFGATPAMTVIVSLICTLCLALGIKKALGLWLVRAFLEQLVFLFFSALTFIALIGLVVSEPALTLASSLVFGSAFILSWTVGLVTPGAPAGAGVRELVLMACLGGLVADEDLLAAVIISRLVTVVGDMLFFLLASRMLTAARVKTG
jgi:hypothetical protein